MKPIIGILTRPDILTSGNKVEVIYNDIKTSIISSGGIPIGILSNLEGINDDLKSIIDECDGIILQGGDHFNDSDLEIVKYIYENDIPILGICLGMQLMGSFLGGKLTNVKGHLSHPQKYAHKVYLDKKSKLYEIFECEKIEVNSRHKEMLIEPNCNVVGISEDGIIEAIEDRKKKFFIGVEWHPENMYSYDILEHKLFDYFVSVCGK